MLTAHGIVRRGRMLPNKMILLYVPMIYRQDEGLWPPSNPSSWYFKWQKQLWNLFLSVGACKPGRLKVIWKAGPRTSNLSDPIKTYKDSTGTIHYSERSLQGELKRCDIVLVDFLSTPMMEAIMVDKTVWCVTPAWDRPFISNDVDLSRVYFFENIDQGINIIRGRIHESIPK